MARFQALSLYLLSFCLQSFASPTKAGEPFLKALNSSAWIIGNDIWNLTIAQTYGTKLMYKGYDLVGEAVGHYVSYNGAVDNLNWTSARIVKKSGDYTDIAFSANEGDMHWVLTPDLFGAYQYFVNRALPTLGEFRTLWRLDNTTFTRGHTSERDQDLPPLALILSGTKVQDETWLLPNGTYVTKYDFATFLPSIEGNLSYWGVYGQLNGTGAQIGSWYIHAGKDYFNGDHLKQELIVHRESSSGDAVQLNMIHGTHYQAVSNDTFPVGKTWGPWLWYVNDGSASDAAPRAQQENKDWPYAWFQDSYGYHSRGSLSGRVVLSDGRAATGAAVFLGDNHPNKTALDQGSWYYYRTYADSNGNFEFNNVREGMWGLQAWADGGKIGDVTTSFLRNDVSVAKNKQTKLGTMTWKTQGRKKIWQIGQIDRKATDFEYSGPPHQHARVVKCPANFTYTVGKSTTDDWCFGQSDIGKWTVSFDVPPFPSGSSSPAAVLSVSLAGYSSGVSSNILANNVMIGNLTSEDILSDPCLYRSGTLAGEWHYYEFELPAGTLKKGSNTVDFQCTRTTLWHGFMWDSVMLEWK
ncbi:polysaccharide lyase family 4 protein [Rhizodiscina lignyota]|uniref:rhamnogalacturonan endolyase n=1 Tax=Rhizodiscina lignyota TaxID=1504668 RepID=A0A9P4I531_9PEZI|nr:polysaccharide lyase family 4 protein [Rhizodiscina lignyota]